MNSPLIGLGCLAAVIAAGSGVRPADGGASLEDRRSAVSRALPYLARQTGTWIEEKKCTSCHQVPHALWAMNAARASGLTVDDRLTEWNRWAVAFVLREADESEYDDARAVERADEAYQMLLAGSTADVEGDGGPVTARERLVSLLGEGQRTDGLWQAGGQLPGQKRPRAETDETTTLWTLHALASHGGEATEKQAARARAKVKLEARSTSIEHVVLRYLLALDDGEKAQAKALQRQILSQQNEDGGWGWLLDGDSDALATGQVLYAFSYMEEKQHGEAERRAHRFLVETQQPDGSWQVPSTLEDKEDQPYVVVNDWGTAWAVIGLTQTMGK